MTAAGVRALGSRDDLEQFLVSRHQNLLRFAYVISKDAEDANDLLQGALVEVFRRWRTIDPSGAEAYTRKVMARRAWRAARAVRPVHLEALSVEPPSADTDLPAVLDLRAAVSALAPDRRIVLVLRYWLDYTEQQVADELGCSIGTVKSRAHRALADLRTQLATTDEPPQLSIGHNSNHARKGTRS